MLLYLHRSLDTPESPSTWEVRWSLSTLPKVLFWDFTWSLLPYLCGSGPSLPESLGTALGILLRVESPLTVHSPKKVSTLWALVGRQQLSVFYLLRLRRVYPGRARRGPSQCADSDTYSSRHRGLSSVRTVGAGTEATGSVFNGLIYLSHTPAPDVVTSRTPEGDSSDPK